jgi:hypothetical protein
MEPRTGAARSRTGLNQSPENDHSPGKPQSDDLVIIAQIAARVSSKPGERAYIDPDMDDINMA